MKSLIIILTLFLAYNIDAQVWEFTEPVRLSDKINSGAEESMPVFSKDSMILYFVRTFDKTNTGGENDQDIWFSKKANGEFGAAEKLTALNNEYHNAVFSTNGKTLYLLSSYEGKKDFIKGCATSMFASNKWSEPKRIEIPGLDIEGNFYSFCMNIKQDVLIISYMGPGTLGEEDLYYTKKDASGKWSEPKTLGNTLNTKGYEISPFLSVTGDTLFFSSNGHGGYGDADVFYSVKNGSWDNWSKPINLGKSINSPKFDAYFSYSEKQVFWSSNRDGQNADIYMSKPFYKTPLLANASGTDVTIHKGSDGKIQLNVSGGKGPYTYLWSNGSTEEDPQNLPKGTYTVKVTDQWNQTVDLVVEINEPAPVVEKLEEIIYFDLDEYSFNEENIATLDAFISKLKGKQNYTLLIESHCDQRASVAYNVRLSKNRMNAVMNYIAKKGGVSKKQMKGEYRGKSIPLFDCEPCDEGQYRQNRRTTIKLIMN